MNLIARTPSSAVRAAIDSLSSAVDGVTDAILIQVGARPQPAIYSVALSQNPAPLRGGLPGISLALGLEYRAVVVPEEPSRWQAELAGYKFTIHTTSDNRELVAFHWHPDGRSPIDFPHLHVGHDRESTTGPLAKAHIPTGAVPLPDVLRMAITDLGVRPRRRDWARVFDAARRLAP